MFKSVLEFSGIRVPVRMYAAVESKRIGFHMLHDKDQVRLRQVLVCEKEGHSVPREEVVKGLAVDEGRYVLVGPEELAALEPETDRTIAVRCFTGQERVDPRYFDRPYHLGPDGEEASYASLVQALGRASKVGVCEWSFRKRDYAGLLRVAESVLELIALRLADDIDDPGALDISGTRLSKKERDTAAYLVDELSDEFDPRAYHNDFEQALAELIQTKAHGGKVKRRKPREREHTRSKDLADVLEASLREAKGRKSGGKSKRSRGDT